MLEHDYTAKVLNLEDVMIKNVDCNLDELHFYLELPVSEHTCPSCGCSTSFVHDYREQVIKDIPLGRKHIFIFAKGGMYVLIAQSAFMSAIRSWPVITVQPPDW